VTRSGDAPQRADAQRNRTRILAAAEAVFSEHGAAGTTEDVARRAQVAIGTVFRHFPTKRELLQAIMKALLQRLAERAEQLHHAEPADGLFAFFRYLVAEAAAKRGVVDLLAQAGADVPVAEAVNALRRAVHKLLTSAQQAGSVRRDVALDEVMALLSATSEGALQGEWGDDLQHRTLAVIFTGLRNHNGHDRQDRNVSGTRRKTLKP
jgi:AcrR family transcriptional regulator